MPLAEALQAICLHGSGAILSYLPGRLAYYRPESPGAGILLGILAAALAAFFAMAIAAPQASMAQETGKPHWILELKDGTVDIELLPISRPTTWPASSSSPTRASITASCSTASSRASWPRAATRPAPAWAARSTRT